MNSESAAMLLATQAVFFTMAMVFTTAWVQNCCLFLANAYHGQEANIPKQLQMIVVISWALFFLALKIG